MHTLQLSHRSNMQLNYSTVEIQVNNLSSKNAKYISKHSDKTHSTKFDEILPFKKPGRALNKYDWADAQFYAGKISASVLHTLKGVLAQSTLVGSVLICDATISQINQSRTKSTSKRFAQADSVTDRTVLRHIPKIEETFPEMFVVDRYKNGYEARNAYYIMLPEEYLVDQRSTIMAPPINSSTSEVCNINHDHTLEAVSEYYSLQKDHDFRNKSAKERKEKQAEQPKDAPKDKMPYLYQRQISALLDRFNHDQISTYEKLIQAGVFNHIAVGWLQRVPVYILNDFVECSKEAHVNIAGRYINNCVKKWLLHNIN